MKLILVHLNQDPRTPPPDTMYQAIHQMYQTSESSHTIVLTNRHFIDTVQKRVYNIVAPRLTDNNHYMTVVPMDLLEDYNRSNKYKYNDSEFRSQFWKYTTERFFAIEAYLEAFQDDEPFLHIENDVMLYTDLVKLEETFDKERRRKPEKMSFIIKDAENRGIGSLLYSNRQEWTQFITYVLEKQKSELVNDMHLLGMYPNFNTLPIAPTKNGHGIYDAACIGQYLGGVDPNNIPNSTELQRYSNPSIGFINETSVVDPSKFQIIRKQVYTDDQGKHSIDKYYLLNNSKFVPIHNLHIHSKHMAPFSSVFDYKYSDIITGDRVVSLADVVFCTNQIYNYHKGLFNFNKNVITVKDFTNVNTDALKTIITDLRKPIVRIFVYTHILDQFIQYIHPTLSQVQDVKYIYYIHNSDHHFEDKHTKLVQDPTTFCVYSQNINTQPTPKLKLLPIGLANSMFPHGDVLTLYKTMCRTYINKKTNNLFISFVGRLTHQSRRPLQDALTNNKGFELQESMSFKEYLNTLSTHFFALCPRGNGTDTHRFWESLYLGAIPVVIKTSDTNNDYFIEALERENIPHYTVTNLDFFKTITDDYFNRDLYDTTLKKFGVCSLQNGVKGLKISEYSV